MKLHNKKMKGEAKCGFSFIFFFNLFGAVLMMLYQPKYEYITL